jgi:hypothetical protein
MHCAHSLYMSHENTFRYLVPFGTFSLSNERQLAGTKPVNIILDVPQVLLNVVAV